MTELTEEEKKIYHEEGLYEAVEAVSKRTGRPPYVACHFVYNYRDKLFNSLSLSDRLRHYAASIEDTWGQKEAADVMRQAADELERH